MTRREAVLTAGGIFLVSVVARALFATTIRFPAPEDTAYYFGVARNIVEGRGIVTDAIWSYGTPPLVFPRPAFEVWLPLPTFLAAIPMGLLGATFSAAQVSSVLIGSIVPVLAWRLAADVAAGRGLPDGRARTLAIGTGVTAAVSLPLQGQAKRGELLAELIVEVARDARALVFLRGHDPLEQRGDVFVRLGTGLHFGLERTSALADARIELCLDHAQRLGGLLLHREVASNLGEAQALAQPDGRATAIEA